MVKADEEREGGEGCEIEATRATPERVPPRRSWEHKRPPSAMSAVVTIRGRLLPL